MADFTKQVVSAGALTTGEMLSIVFDLAELRRNNQEIEAELARVEGQATLAAGEAQRDAYQEEADQSRHRAIQSFAEAGANLGSEAIGEMGERISSRTETAQRMEQKVANYDKWDDLLNKPQKAKVEAGYTDSRTSTRETIELTPTEVNAIKSLRPHIVSGDNPDLLFSPTAESNPAINRARLEAAARADSPALDDLRSELRSRSKKAEKANESRSQRVERRRNQLKTISQAVYQSIQAQQSMEIAKSQDTEAMAKLYGTQADFAKDSLARTNKSLEDSNSALSSAISGTIAASNKEWEANARA